jgi:hypothetical protein
MQPLASHRLSHPALNREEEIMPARLPHNRLALGALATEYRKSA